MTKKKILLLLFVFAILGYFARPWVDAWLPGQMMKKSMPELEVIYQPSVMLENKLRNPVIVIPGMMGSKLETSDGRTVWGVFSNKSIDPTTKMMSGCCAVPLMVRA